MKRYNLALENINTIEDVDQVEKVIKEAYSINKLSEENYDSLLLELAEIKHTLIILNENKIGAINSLNIIVPNESDRNQGTPDNTYFKIYRGKIKNLRRDPCLRISLLTPTYAGNGENSKHDATDKKKLDKSEKELLMTFFNQPFIIPPENSSATKIDEYNQMKAQFLKEKNDMKIHKQDISYLPDIPSNWIATLFYYNNLNYSPYTSSIVFPLTTKIPNYLTL